MGFIDDVFRMTRKVERTVDTVEKIDRSLYQQKVATLVSQYDQGEISATKFEKELSSYVDDPDAPIQIIVQDVNGVGEATAKSIANEYNSLKELERTDRDRIESVRGVGSSTADKILERIQ